MTTTEIAELEAKLAELKATEEKNRKTLRDSIPQVYKFTFKYAKSDSFDRIRKTSNVVKFRLDGVIVNEDEIKAVGGRTDHQGGMGYLVNMADVNNPRIICPVSGGYVWIQENDEEIYLKLEEFLRDNIQGGDVTHIIRQPKPHFYY